MMKQFARAEKVAVRLEMGRVARTAIDDWYRNSGVYYSGPHASLYMRIRGVLNEYTQSDTQDNEKGKA